MGYVVRSGEAKTKTFRIDNAFIDELEEEAKQQGLSTNTLAERIIERYINHSRWIDKMDALSILPQTMNKLLEKIDDKTIEELGAELGSMIPKEGFLIRGMNDSRASAKILVEEILGGFQHWFNASYHESDKPYYYLRSRHSVRWMKFVEAYLKAFFKSMDIEAQIIRRGSNIQILV